MIGGMVIAESADHKRREEPQKTRQDKMTRKK